MASRFHAVASSGRHSSTKSEVTKAPVSTAVLVHILCQLGCAVPFNEYGSRYMLCREGLMGANVAVREPPTAERIDSFVSISVSNVPVTGVMLSGITETRECGAEAEAAVLPQIASSVQTMSLMDILCADRIVI